MGQKGNNRKAPMSADRREALAKARTEKRAGRNSEAAQSGKSKPRKNKSRGVGIESRP